MIGTKGLPSLHPVGGGIETHVENLSRQLVARGHDVTIYMRKYANPQGKKTFKGMRLITISSWYRKHFDTISHTLLASIHALTEPYDIIHYHGVGPSTLAWIPRIFKRDTRIIVTFHSRDQFHEKWGLLARMYLALGEWTAVKIPHATTVTSHALQLFCKKMFDIETVYVPNGVNPPKRIPKKALLKKLGLTSGKYFLCLARLVPHKAQDDAIKAFKNINTTDKLAIVGSASFDDAEYAEKLEKLAKPDKRVVFTGHQSGEVLKQLISHCRALVHPSRSEGLSISVLEAMSYGKIVIMSDIPENLELIDHAGISYPLGNVDSLNYAMQWVLDDPTAAKERGERGRRIVERLYSWEAVSKRMEQVYTGKLTNQYAIKTHRPAKATAR